MRFARASGVLVVLAAVLSCSREPTVSLPSASNFIAQVALASNPSLVAVRATGQPPNSGPTNGTLALTTPAVVINGGSAQVTVDAGGSVFQTVVVYVNGRPDYFVLNLPAAVTTTDLIITLAATLPGSFEWVFGVGPDAPGVGNYTARFTNVLAVLSGDVQVSVAWDADTDVDLHVVEPSGEEIYYGATQSATGGVLDLDSNAGCSIDGVRNENITWPNVTPPSGTYTVRVDYWSACGQSQTNYVVTFLVRGKSPQTFTGTFTGPGDGGGAGSGVTIGTFTYP